MRSITFPPTPPILPAILSLFLAMLALTGCATSSTPRPTARTERPSLPALPAELTATEQLRPLVAKPAGVPVTIDRSILSELAERLAEAIGAVERGNRRAVAVRTERTCLDAIYRTGTAPADCPTN